MKQRDYQYASDIQYHDRHTPESHEQKRGSTRQAVHHCALLQTAKYSIITK
jgi:hypothetical protein